jgi:glucose-6-phosphate 1-dehydrogenase
MRSGPSSTSQPCCTCGRPPHTSASARPDARTRTAAVFEACERLILDAMRADQTLFTTADGIERLWEVSSALLASPPPVRPYSPGPWGPYAIHRLIVPKSWRLPFERAQGS